MSHVTLAEVRQQFTLWRNARQPGSRIPARLWAAAACTALSRRLCRAWDWTQPNGQLKAMVCRGLMLRLHREGYLTLPRSQNSRPGNANTHQIPEPVEIDTTPIRGTVKELAPRIELRQVRRTPDEKLCNALVEQYHYLGYTRPVGEHLKHMAFVDGRPIGCLLFSSAAFGLKVRALLVRAETGVLDPGDYEIIKAMAQCIVSLSHAVDEKAVKIKKLLRMIFGASTEKKENVLGEASPDAADGLHPVGRGQHKSRAARHAVDAKVRLYDRLFTVAAPEGDKDKDFLDHINPDSLEILKNCKLEPGLADAEPEENRQFERSGYFSLDPKASQPGKPVFNRTVTLRDSWAKINK